MNRLGELSSREMRNIFRMVATHNAKEKMYLYIFHIMTVFVFGVEAALLIYFTAKAVFYFINWRDGSILN